MHIEMFLTYSKIGWMFMSWISKDYPVHRLLSYRKNVVTSKIIHPFFAIL